MPDREALSRESDLASDPPIIAYLRNKLAHEHDLPGADDGALFATLVGRSMRGLGVRPEILAHHDDGTKMYGLTRSQAARVIRRYDEIREKALGRA